MPRISAPTLVEHRAQQYATLLAAAEDIALRSGGRAVTLTAVAEETGLARSTLYEYVSSAEDLLAALVVDAMRRWTDDVQAAVRRAGTPERQVRAYVRACLRLVGEGRHRLAAALADTQLPASWREAVRAEHERLDAPLHAALRGMGVARPERAAALVQGAVAAATRRIEAGEPVRAETQAAEAFVMGGLAALPGTTPGC